ncbi:MAG: hypothetical protein SVU88_03200 [Candidatus Nanohaloarchaea archaeon]|nr:hypothetical protein [Candidatus Nanohaloarchaea archaeon]
MIVGFSIDRMDAQKDGLQGGETDINYSSGLTDVEDAEVASLDETVARISFELALQYQQDGDDVADMSFEGSVLWRGDDAEDLIEQYEEDEDIDDEVAAQVTNHIYRKCLTRAVGMADALELPSPVPMPRVDLSQ